MRNNLNLNSLSQFLNCLKGILCAIFNQIWANHRVVSIYTLHSNQWTQIVSNFTNTHWNTFCLISMLKLNNVHKYISDEHTDIWFKMYGFKVIGYFHPKHLHMLGLLYINCWTNCLWFYERHCICVCLLDPQQGSSPASRTSHKHLCSFRNTLGRENHLGFNPKMHLRGTKWA